MTFGEKLKSARLALNLTQEALAEKVGCHKQTISRYENSEREPNIRTAAKLAKAMGISIHELTDTPYTDTVTAEQVRYWLANTATKEEILAFIQQAADLLK